MNGPSIAFYRAGLVVLSVACAFLLGMRADRGSRVLAEGGDTSTVGGGRSAGGGTADGDRNMIAVTGTSASGSAVLYLVDTKLKRLAVYQATGKNIELVAARNIEYDLKLDSYRDDSPEEVQVGRLREKWLRSQGAKAGDKSGDAAGDAAGDTGKK